MGVEDGAGRRLREEGRMERERQVYLQGREALLRTMAEQTQRHDETVSSMECALNRRLCSQDAASRVSAFTHIGNCLVPLFPCSPIYLHNYINL